MDAYSPVGVAVTVFTIASYPQLWVFCTLIGPTLHQLSLDSCHLPFVYQTETLGNTEITFLDTVVYKGKRFRDHSILDIKTHFKPTETFQYNHFSSSHPLGVKKGFVKDFNELTLQEQHLKRTLTNLNHVSLLEGIQNV